MGLHGNWKGLVGGVQAQACRWGRIGKRCITYVLGPKICYGLEIAWAVFAILGSKAWKSRSGKRLSQCSDAM